MVTPDPEILQDPVVFPVYVDPPFTGRLQAGAYANTRNETIGSGRAEIGGRRAQRP
jgi:hypothetical protein